MDTVQQITVGLREEFPHATQEQKELIHIYADKLLAGELTFEEAVRLIGGEDHLANCDCGGDPLGGDGEDD